MAFQPANFLLQGVSGTVFGAISTVPTPAVITSDGGGPTADVSVSTGDTAVTTVTADGTGTEIFSIVGGAEAGMFEIDPDSGDLAFTTTSVDGVYEVIVKATNDWGSDTQTITVTVETAGYHADAVHFDGATSLSIESLTCTDSGVAAFSLWLKIATAQTSKSIWISAPETDGTTTMNINGANKLHPVFGSEDFDACEGLATSALSTVTWYHFLGSAKTNLAAGAKIFTLYLNDVNVSTVPAIDGGAASFVIAMNGRSFFLGDDTFNAFAVIDIADFWIAPNQSLLDGDGDIPEATRRKFISASGKPVDLGADGSTPTGIAPTIFFSGDATAFATNLGTGGAFTLTGSLTNAADSPSD